MLQKVELKQRIIGGIVLVSLAVILVPFLMDDPREEVKLMESNIPPWPDNLPKTVIEISDDDFLPTPKRPAKPKPASKPVSRPVATPKPEVKPKSKPESKPGKSTPVAESKAKESGKRYEVQVVSYGAKSRKRAESFLKKMQSKGYKVRLSEITRKGKKSLRIVTESLASKKEAKEMSKKIDREFKVDQVKSMVRSLK
ncbi:MAG: SPOR domain-containing protein [Gammaproteobacteria bacterium]|uniref:SPOR domain-containing protein n=1 Tax=Candidatus Thiopontia autotrophica TaxID=2841688 RepID=A0A8J6TXT2_9GAMM|nr:SPOR domain-containing protein [Candidatus Thiopontia autotrophica]MBL6969148.1 SPOR domain-containing protein [Gammaproteobacteria bacterium]